LGASDVAWFVGALGTGGIDELAPVWPQRGAFTGGLDGGSGSCAYWWWWWVMVVVVGRDGDVTPCDGRDISTALA